MATNTLVELKEVLTYLRIDKEDKYNDELRLLLATCSGIIIERLAPRDIFIQDYASEYHDIDGDTSTIFTNQYPVATVTSVVESSNTLTEDTSFKINKSLGQIHRTSGVSDVSFTVGKKSIAVTYRAGYAIPKIPQSLKQACLELNHFKFTQRDGGALEKISFGATRGETGISVRKLKEGLPENVYYSILSHMDTRVK